MYAFLVTVWIVAFLVTVIVLQGLRKIPADPPHKAIVTRFGERTSKIKNEGWRFFFLCPYWHGYILVKVTKINQDLPPQLIRTPDMAELEIPLSLTWTPVSINLKDEDGNPINGLTNYLNAGGEKGVREILDDIVRERLREWAMSAVEGPLTWEEALDAREDAVNALVKAIVGREALGKIDSPVPTSILLRFYYKLKGRFEGVREEDELYETEQSLRAIQNWIVLKKYFDGLAPEKKKALLKEIENRKEILTNMRSGHGDKLLPQLGIRLDRLNIDEIKPRGELAKSAEKKAMEMKEAQGDQVKINNIITRVQELQLALKISPEQALEIIQTEKGKVTKQISESKWNMSQETRQMVERIAPGILEKILSKV